MPIYSYRCSKCQSEVDKLIPMQDRDKIQSCVCGGILERLITAPTFKINKNGRDIVLNTLNREYKTLPPRQVEIMAPGLNPPSIPITGRGF